MATYKTRSWSIITMVLVGIIIGGAGYNLARQSRSQSGSNEMTLDIGSGKPAQLQPVPIESTPPNTTTQSSSRGQYSYQTQTTVNGRTNGSHQEWSYGPETGQQWRQTRDSHF